MAGFKLEIFKGIRPRISAVKLPHGEATTAENVRLGSADLEPWDDKSTEQAVSAGRESRTIYRFDNNDNPIWLEWNDVVDVVRGPVKGDDLERTYYTGDTTGTGAPKMTNTNLVGSTGPYPEDWVYLGVPAPVSAPVVVVFELPENVPSDERFIPHLSIKNDELIIDNVNWTVYPGAGSRNQTWRLNAAATGDIAFDVQAGTSFRVTEVINFNKVRLESASEPGIFARTLNSDKTTVNDWQPMDEQGTSGPNQEADFVGWRLPVDTEVTIVGHRLAVGDVITVSAIAIPIAWGTSLTDDLHEQSWATEVLIDRPEGSFQNVANAHISPAASLGAEQFVMSGSFYYDVDRAASTVSELEDRRYVYTYVTDNGEEGPPSPVSDTSPILDGVAVLVDQMALPPTIGFNITKMRLYRTASSEAGTEFQFVKEFNLDRNVFDEVPSAELGEVISTTTWDPPDPEMVGLTSMPNGMMVGFKGKNIYFCEPYFPHAWPPEYDQAIDYEIIGLASFGNSIAVMTKGWPYLLTGSHPRNVNVRPIKVKQACSSALSIATDSDKVYYASPDGLVEISVNGVRVATQKYIEKKDWQAYDPTTIVGSFHEGRYYGFYDFDVSAIDPVITAEVSGTIAQTTEDDVINGGKTIILTLTNDLWVLDGALFDAQRQNIIDGLTAATSQTLGWNNIVRDTELQVTDVVRTSDTVATITLPTASGYSISSDEVIQPLIPATALQVSTSALPTGSTFSVIALAPEGTVSIGGTLDTDDEAAVRAGGSTITLTLTNDTWVAAGTTFDNVRQSIIAGIQATTDETDGWNDTAIQEIALTDVVRTSDLIVTITLPAIAAYDITADESLTATAPAAAVVVSTVGIDSLNSLAILALGGNPSALFSGSILGATENDIIAGGKQVIITLTDDTWIAAGTGPIGTIAQTDAIIAAVLATTSQTLGWNNVVLAGIETTDLVRTNPNTATITLDAEASYSIATSETIGMDIPNDVLVTSTEDLTVSNTFGITAQAPITCALTGTVTASIAELDIVNGGKTIILTLTSDTWLAAGSGPIGSTANTQAIIDGIDAASSPAGGWNLVVQPGIETADVVRTSDTVATITLDAEASYDISSQETIEATIPAAALNISASAVVATPTFTVDTDVPASVALTGTITSSADNDDIIAGGKTIILTVSDDEWVASGATFNAQRQNIIDGLTAAATPTFGWNNMVRDIELDVGDVVRTSNTVVTITVPATATYDINGNEVITATVPASALVTEASPVVATPTFTVTANSTATSRIFTGYRNLWDNDPDGGTQRSFFDPDYFVDDGEVFADNKLWSLAHDGASTLVSVSDDFAGFPDTVKIYSSTDLGASWTLRHTITDDGLAFCKWIDSDGGMFLMSRTALVGDEFRYSTDGITWTDITAAVTFVQGLNFGGVPFYGGANLVYFVDGDGTQVIPSASLAGAGDVEDNWGTAISTDTGVMASGNGMLLGIFQVSTNEKVSWMAHGGSSFSQSTGLITGGPSVGPVFAAFGNDIWLAVNGSGGYWRCDINGGAVDETDASNWTTGTLSISPDDLIYDDDFGFVAAEINGTGASRTTKIYTSTNGTSWTERAELGPVVEHLSLTLTSINLINGTSLD